MNNEIDFDVIDAMNFLLEKGLTNIQNDLEDWKLEGEKGNQWLFYKGSNYIPKDLLLWQDIVCSFHDQETAGHPGELETFNSVKQYYWWPGLWSFVKNYVKGCGTCQQFKIDRNPSHPSFMPVEGATSTWPFNHCSMDMITDLPTSNSCDSILSMVDQGLSKEVILIPTNKTINAEGISKLLQDNLFKHFGLPDRIISDRGPQFAAKTFRTLLERLGIKSSLSTAYHPQTDGMTEQINQEIEAYLSIYCSLNPKTWSQSLLTLEFTHNNRRHTNRTQTLFELMFGSLPIAILTFYKHTKFPLIDEKIKQIQQDEKKC